VKRELLKYFVFAVCVLLAPLAFLDSYLLNVLVFVGIHTMLAVGLNLLLGYAGQISLGHAAFFGLGAYLSGVLTTTYSWNPWLTMLVAAVVVGGMAFAIGFPILKLKGHYLAMATLGLGIIIFIVFNEWVDVTSGPSGFSGIPNLQLGQLVFDSDLKNYYLVWCFVLGCVLLSVNLANSRIGRALRAILRPVGHDLGHCRFALRPCDDLYRAALLWLQHLGGAADHGGDRGLGQHLRLVPGSVAANDVAGIPALHA